jgi:hypothetical protein
MRHQSHDPHNTAQRHAPVRTIASTGTSLGDFGRVSSPSSPNTNQGTSEDSFAAGASPILLEGLAVLLVARSSLERRRDAVGSGSFCPALSAARRRSARASDRARMSRGARGAGQGSSCSRGTCCARSRRRPACRGCSARAGAGTSTWCRSRRGPSTLLRAGSRGGLHRPAPPPASSLAPRPPAPRSAPRARWRLSLGPGRPPRPRTRCSPTAPRRAARWDRAAWITLEARPPRRPRPHKRPASRSAARDIAGCRGRSGHRNRRAHRVGRHTRAAARIAMPFRSRAARSTARRACSRRCSRMFDPRWSAARRMRVRRAPRRTRAARAPRTRRRAGTCDRGNPPARGRSRRRNRNTRCAPPCSRSPRRRPTATDIRAARGSAVP